MTTLAAATRGRSAAARCGAGSPTTPSSTSIYYGTGNPGPVEPRAAARRQQVDARASSRASPTPARRSGSTRCSPHDLHDYDGINENILRRPADRAAARARCCVHPERNGYVYVIDRTTGEVLSADPFVLRHDVDRRRPEDRRAAATTRRRSRSVGKVVRDICPASPGVKDWQPSAYSPRTRPALHPAPEPVHGRGGRRGELHRRHAVRRRRT